MAEKRWLARIPHAYPGDIGLGGMVFLRRDQQKHSVPHLDATQRGYTHVEEDAEQGRHRNHLQDRFHVNRNTWKSQRGTGRSFIMILLWQHLHCRWQHLPTMMATTMPLILCSSTFSISGFGPLDMTVKALAWVTDRTVAALIQGTPKIEAMPPMVTRMSRSQWNPDPFTIFLSGLLTIRLKTETVKSCILMSHEVIFSLQLFHLLSHSRSNLGLQKDEDEHEQCWYTAGSHHPDWEVLLFPHGVD